MSIIEFQKVSRIYQVGDHEQKALDNIDLDIQEGKFIVILGPSGAGKSTLLNMLGGLDSPTSGKILVEGNDIANLNNDELADYRALTVGFVFQSYNLIPTLTVFENVALVKEICKNHLPVKEMLNEVGLIDYIDKFPSELSGGELQRLSIARAILKDSKIVILDEATANVDPENEEKLMKAIDSLTLNKTVIMIAHRLKTVRNCDNIFVINEGKIVESGRHEDLIKQDGIYKRFVLDRKEAVGWKI